MTAHGMPADRFEQATIRRRSQSPEFVGQQSWQLVRHVGPHLIVLGVGWFRRVDVKPGALSQVVGRGVVGHHAALAIGAAPRRRIRHHNGHPGVLGCREGQRTGLLRKIRIVAGQSGQPHQHGDGGLARSGRSRIVAVTGG